MVLEIAFIAMTKAVSILARGKGTKRNLIATATCILVDCLRNGYEVESKTEAKEGGIGSVRVEQQ